MIIAALSLVGALTSAEAQVVRVRPSAPIAVRPACPSRGHIWVNESWKWNHRTNTYAFVNGWLAVCSRALGLVGFYIHIFSWFKTSLFKARFFYFLFQLLENCWRQHG